MTRLKLNPKIVQTVVISHIHQDHLGGLEGFLMENSDVTVYIPATFPDSIRRMIRATGADLKNVARLTELAPNIFTTGPLRNGLNEQALVVDTEQGLVIMTGYAHPGIVRVVEAAHARRPSRPIALVMGGFRLLSTTPPILGESFRRSAVSAWKRSRHPIARATWPAAVSGSRMERASSKEGQEWF